MSDPVMLAIAELAKQVRELTERVSYLEHARAQDAQRIDAHGLFIRRFFKWARLPKSLRRASVHEEEFATIRAEIEKREQQQERRND